TSLGTKCQKGGDGDLTDGPVKSRKCTDLVCVLLFLAHAAFFWYLAAVSISAGDPRQLYTPRDFRGDYCGLSGISSLNLEPIPGLAFATPGSQTNASGGNLSSVPILAFALSVSQMVDPLAQSLVCS
ncbi:unnamed protein product, partial [Polarella glacialis]